MTYFFWHIKTAKVCNYTDAKHLDTAMAGHYHFGYGAHAYCICAKQAVHAILCWGLKCRSLYAYVHAMNQTGALLPSYLIGQLTQTVVIGFVHVGEAGALRVVLAVQGMLGEEVDVVVDDHQIADFEVWIHAAGCIRDKQRLDAQFAHYALWECHLLHVISFIVMESSLHRHDIFPAKFAEYQPSGVAFNGREGKVGNFCVGERIGISNL